MLLHCATFNNIVDVYFVSSLSQQHLLIQYLQLRNSPDVLLTGQDGEPIYGQYLNYPPNNVQVTYRLASRSDDENSSASIIHLCYYESGRYLTCVGAECVPQNVKWYSLAAARSVHPHLPYRVYLVYRSRSIFKPSRITGWLSCVVSGLFLLSRATFFLVDVPVLFRVRFAAGKRCR